MLITLLLSLCLMISLFVLLYAAVALIQDRRFFTTAPKAIQEVIEDKKERFKGAHFLGYFLAIVSILSMIIALIYAGIDGKNNNFGFIDYFLRYLIMFLLLKAFDIIFFDYYLLGKSNFFTHYYPETKEYVGLKNFGYNIKDHLIQIVIFIVFSFVVALLLSKISL